MTRRVLVVLVATVGTLVVAPSAAQAFTTLPVWKCRASPTYASVNGLNRVEPVTANGNINTANGNDPDHQQCAPAEAGAGNTATQIGIPQDILGASSASGVTTITPEIGRAIDQKVTAAAKAENLQLQLPAGSPSLLGVKAATSSATGSCSAGKLTPNLAGTSQVADLTVLGAAVASGRPGRRADDGAAAARLPRRHQDQREDHVHDRERRVADRPCAAREGHPRQRHARRRPRGRREQGLRQRSGLRSGQAERRRRQRRRHLPEGLGARPVDEPLRHQGFDLRLEPRRRHRRAPVPGSQRRHGRADRHRAQEVRANAMPRLQR